MSHRDWRNITALELLLAERLRRAETCEDEVVAQQKLRDRVRTGIEAHFVVTCSRRHAVRLTDVKAAAGERGKPGTQWYISNALIRSVVEEMGGKHVKRRNRRFVNGLRLASETDAEANVRTRRLRHDPWEEAVGRLRGLWRESKTPISRRKPRETGVAPTR